MSKVKIIYETSTDTVEFYRANLLGVWRVIFKLPYDQFKGLFDHAVLVRTLYYDDEKEGN